MGRIENFRRRLLLEDREIPLHRAEWQLMILRRAILSVSVPALIAGGLFAANWPLAKGRALRIMLDRQVAMAGIGAAAYAQGVSEVTDLELRVHGDMSLPEGERTRKFWDLDAIRINLRANQEAMRNTFQQAVTARNALPKRVWGRTLWMDPLTGGMFPAYASRETIAQGLTVRRLEGPDQKMFLTLVLAASRPGADPLPTEQALLDAL